ELVEQHRRVDDDPVADDVADAGRQDPGGDQVQGEVLAVRQHHRVAGVVAALITHHPLHASTEQVGGLALALVAPLGADQDDRRHRNSYWVRLPRFSGPVFGPYRAPGVRTVRGARGGPGVHAPGRLNPEPT